MLAALALSLATTAEPPSARAYYRAAVAQMRGVPAPPFVTYRTEIPAGQSTLVVRVEGGSVVVVLEMGGAAPPIHWDVAYAAASGLAYVTLADGTRLQSTLATFDPTWTGVYRWMLRGFSAAPLPVAPSSPPSSGSKASPLPVIAVVSAMSADDYTIEDAGSGDCDGHSGHALRLRATHDPQGHPLSGVTIDPATLRFCSLRFALRSGSVATNISSTVELHFGVVGGYYLVTGGRIESDVRTMGIATAHYVTPFHYTHMTFPAALPAASDRP